MLAEFLTKLEAMVVSAQFAKHDLKSIPGKMVVVKPGGSLDVLDAPAKLRAPVLFTVEDVVKIVTACKTGPELFVSTNGVEIVFDRTSGHQVGSMPLVYDPQFVALSALKDGKSFDVPALVRFLRFELGGDEAEVLLAKVRTLTFKRRDDQTVTAIHGKDSMGREVEATVLEAANVPDFFEPRARVFSNRGTEFIATVGVGVTLDAKEGKVLLRTLPGHLEDAKALALQSVLDELRRCLPGIPIYSGLADNKA